MNRYDGYALITGGSSGIGLAFAHQLAAQGYPLVLVAHNKEKLKHIANGLKKKYKVKVLTISQDLSDIKSTNKIYNTLKAKKIHVGLLVNNAGFAPGIDQFLTLDHKRTLDMLQVMCLSLTDLTYKFLPDMLKKGSGGIIFISSLIAPTPQPNSVVYGAAKAYVLMFGTNLHAEMAGKNIDILTVCPGVINTNLWPKMGFKILPSYMKLKSPHRVAKQALKALGKKIVTHVIDGPEKIFLILAKFLPLWLTEKISTVVANKLAQDLKTANKRQKK